MHNVAHRRCILPQIPHGCGKTRAIRRSSRYKEGDIYIHFALPLDCATLASPERHADPRQLSSIAFRGTRPDAFGRDTSGIAASKQRPVSRNRVALGDSPSHQHHLSRASDSVGMVTA
jgi:hypothetical protein